MATNNILDAEELLHLAIEESNKNNNERSIMFLKQALEQDPANAKAQYMLGAMHAQIGMFDRAVSDMKRAVEIDPELDTAHFQLGLLYITSGNISAAKEAWSALDKLGENNPLFFFKSGILNLVNNEFEECISDLSQGINTNTTNLPLNKDMQMLIDQLKETLSQNTQDNGLENKNQGDGGSHVFLSAYNTDD